MAKISTAFDDSSSDDDDDSSGDSSSSMIDLEPSLKNLVAQKTLKWIFVGGKGGVGKTTTSCSLAVMMAQTRKKVLIISTDPAHNLSDAFGQQFSGKESQVRGISNLYAMEIDPSVDFSEFGDQFEGKTADFLSELSNSIPGIDEAMSFSQLIKQVKKENYDVIIFDTAPTGHTLRLLSFPQILEKAITKIEGLKNKFGGLLSNFQSMLSNPSLPTLDIDKLGKKLAEMKKNVEIIRKQFENDAMTTFVCVCIPEFLSLYETERLVQKLNSFKMDSHNIVINQILFKEMGSQCKRCDARVKMQSKYIRQFHDLYPEFHLVKMPLMSDEVRHIGRLKRFAHLLLNPYERMTGEERESQIDVSSTHLNASSSSSTKTIQSNAPITKEKSTENESKMDEDEDDDDDDGDTLEID